MTYRGRVKNGVIVLDDPVTLPDGIEVQVQTVESEAQIPTLYERMKEVIGIAEGLPPDSSAQHDHYLYSTPKK